MKKEHSRLILEACLNNETAVDEWYNRILENTFKEYKENGYIDTKFYFTIRNKTGLTEYAVSRFQLDKAIYNHLITNNYKYEKPIFCASFVCPIFPINDTDIEAFLITKETPLLTTTKVYLVVREADGAIDFHTKDELDPDYKFHPSINLFRRLIQTPTDSYVLN